MPNETTLDDKSFLFTFWKPLLAYIYISIIIFDFIIAPILQPIFLHYIGMQPTPWIPLTLNYGGVFHLSVGGILGATAYTHGLANIEAVKNMPDYSNMPMDNPNAVNIQVNQTPLRHQHADFNNPTASDLAHN